MSEGRITISHPIHNGEEYIEIVVHDRDSVTNFVTITLSLEDYARAISGVARTPVHLSFNGTERLGKKRESQTVHFYVGQKAPTYEQWKKAIDDEAAFYVPDGWLVNDYTYNSKQFNAANGMYTTTLVRYVDSSVTSDST